MINNIKWDKWQPVGINHYQYRHGNSAYVTEIFIIKWMDRYRVRVKAINVNNGYVTNIDIASYKFLNKALKWVNKWIHDHPNGITTNGWILISEYRLNEITLQRITNYLR